MVEDIISSVGNDNQLEKKSSEYTGFKKFLFGSLEALDINVSDYLGITVTFPINCIAIFSFSIAFRAFHLPVPKLLARPTYSWKSLTFTTIHISFTQSFTFHMLFLVIFVKKHLKTLFQ